MRFVAPYNCYAFAFDTAWSTVGVKYFPRHLAPISDFIPSTRHQLKLQDGVPIYSPADAGTNLVTEEMCVNNLSKVTVNSAATGIEDD